MIRTEVSSFTAPGVFAGMPPSGSLQLACHVFEVKGDELYHYTDGELRAVVPESGWTDYAEAYPLAGEVITAARGVA